MNSNLVYQTIQLNCDKEYSAEPLDFTGIRTIKLTNKPTDIEVWISAENTGANLFPLVNRGDGWVNIEEPLQNVYIYTKGTTISGEQLILNVTGQKDIFNYGNNSSERIDKVGLIEGFSPKAQMQLQNAIFNLWNPPKIIKTISLQGQYKQSAGQGTEINENFIILPLPEKIAGLKLDDNKFYKLEFIGHIDNGGEETAEGAGNGVTSCMTHFCIFNNNNGATLTPVTNKKIFDFEDGTCFKLDRNLWASEVNDLFDIFGLKFYGRTAWGQADYGLFQDKGLNFLDNLIIQGSIINKYEDIGLHCYSQMQWCQVYMHCSLLINLYEMQDPTQWAV